MSFRFFLQASANRIAVAFFDIYEHRFYTFLYMIFHTYQHKYLCITCEVSIYTNLTWYMSNKLVIVNVSINGIVKHINIHIQNNLHKLFAYRMLLTLIWCLKLFLTDDEPTGLTGTDVELNSLSPSSADLPREGLLSLSALYVFSAYGSGSP